MWVLAVTLIVLSLACSMWWCRTAMTWGYRPLQRLDDAIFVYGISAIIGMAGGIPIGLMLKNFQP